MKRLFILFCGFLLGGTCAKAQNMPTPVVHKVLLATSTEARAQYQKATDSLINQTKEASEANFWLRYKRLMYAYEHQWNRTVSFSKRYPESAPKVVKKTWKALENGSYAEAMSVIRPALNDQKIGKKQVPVYRFLMELCMAAGDYRYGVEQGWKFLGSGRATTEDTLLYNDCLIGMFAFDEAIFMQDLLEQRHSEDTLILARLRYLRGRDLRYRMDTVRALAPLIEAGYLLSQLRPSAARDALSRTVELEKASLFTSRNDFDNSLKSTRQALSLSASPADRAESMLALGLLYAKGGGMKEAESMLDSAYTLYGGLYRQYPEVYGPAFCDAIEAYALAERWYDKNTRYQQLLEEQVAVRTFLHPYEFAIHRFALARTYFNLGHKFMNMDLKIVPAEKSWQKGDTILKELVKENVVLAGDLYVDNNYKLAGCRSALNKPDEAKEYFLKSLEVRRRLYRIAPKAYAHDLATVLVQNANFDANEKKYTAAVDKMNEAEAMAKESGDERMLEEVVSFRDFLKSKIKK